MGHIVWVRSLRINILFTYQTTVIILCMNVIIFPVSKSNGTSITMYLWPQKKYPMAILIMALCILGCVISLSFLLFSMSSKTSSPRRARFTLPSGSRTSSPKYSLNSHHAFVPGSNTEMEIELCLEQFRIVCELSNKLEDLELCCVIGIIIILPFGRTGSAKVLLAVPRSCATDK